MLCNQNRQTLKNTCFVVALASDYTAVVNIRTTDTSALSAITEDEYVNNEMYIKYDVWCKRSSVCL